MKHLDKSKYIRSLSAEAFRNIEQGPEPATLPTHITDMFAQYDAAMEGRDSVALPDDQVQYLSLRHDFTVVRNRITASDFGLKANFHAEGWLCLRIRFSGDLREQFGLDERVYGGVNASFVNYGEGEEYAFQRISAAPVSGLSLLFRRSFLVEKLGGTSASALRILDGAGQAHTPAPRRHWLTVPNWEPMMTTARELLDAPESHPVFRLWAEAKAMEVLAMALQVLEESYKVEGANLLKPAELRQIQQACEILKRSFAAPPGTDELCRQVGLSRRRMYQGFKLATGQTITEYLQSLRMQHAAVLLSQSKPVALVAERVGYLDQSSFTKVFKRHFGVVPSQYHTG